MRELSNFIERCVILTQGATLEVPVGELKPRPNAEDATGKSLEHIERQHILRALEECNGVISGPAGAAAKLGMKRTSLQYKMQKHRTQLTVLPEGRAAVTEGRQPNAGSVSRRRSPPCPNPYPAS